MELLQLRYFFESARSGSFTKTAEKYMVPTSSVSASIRRLEQELGLKLFSRTNNRITLNENGYRLLAAAKSIFSELELAVNDITNPPDKQVIRLLVLAHRYDVTDMVIEYRDRHPGVMFDICIDYNVQDYSNYDIIIGVPDSKLSDYSGFPLCNSQISFHVPLSHPLCGKSVTLAQLRNQSFVTMGGIMYDAVCEACKKAGFTPNIIATINDSRCYSKLLRSGNIIGFRRNTGNAPSPGFADLDVTDFHLLQTICVFYRESAKTGNIKHFLDYLKTKTQ